MRDSGTTKHQQASAVLVLHCISGCHAFLSGVADVLAEACYELILRLQPAESAWQYVEVVSILAV